MFQVSSCTAHEIFISLVAQGGDGASDLAGDMATLTGDSLPDNLSCRPQPSMYV